MSTRASELWSFWNELVSCGRDSDRLLDLIARHAGDVIGEGAVLATVCVEGGTLELAATHHPDAAVEAHVRQLLGSNPVRLGEGIVGLAVSGRRSVTVSRDDLANARFAIQPAYRTFVEERAVHSLAVVPMFAFGEVVGALGVFRIDSEAPYSEEDVQSLEALAERAALALANARGRVGIDVADYEAIFLHSIDGVLFTVPDGQVLAANPAACEILQRSEAEICRVAREGLLVLEDPRTAIALKARDEMGRARAEIPMIRGDGSVFIAEVASTMFGTSTGELRAVVIFRDVTEKVAMREELERKTVELARLAEQDDLTKLRNRRGYQVAANQALAFADRESVPIQLAFFDVDGLKQINDEHGHQLGDAVLAKLGAAIAMSARAVDVVARLGGDEFVALLYGATRAEAQQIVDRIAEAVHESDGLPPLSFTVGIAERLPGDEMSLSQLMHLADDRMYARKSAKSSAGKRRYR